MEEFDRIQQLQNLLLIRGYLDVHTVAKELGVSIATARRDIRYLTSKNLAARTHGGVYLRSIHSTIYENTMYEKRRLMIAEKQAIGQLAATLVVPGQSILIDAGSTTFEVARHIRDKRPLTVVCNDVFILSLLARSSDITLIDPGGIVRNNFGTLLGSETVNFIHGLHVNTFFMGSDAVDSIKGATITNREEVAVKQAMIEASDRVLLVSDHTKFGKAVFSRVCDLRTVKTIVTDWGISKDQIEQIRSLGIELMIANNDDDNTLREFEEKGSASRNESSYLY
jgi:DeoR/GlpR family transcriptional regulator of sugar metabolism